MKETAREEVQRRQPDRLVTRRAAIGAVAALPALFLAGCGAGQADPGGAQQPTELQTTVFCFDTVCTLRGVMGQDVLDEATALCERFEQLFSRTIESSDVGRINAAAGAPTKVDEKTAELITLALDYSRQSGGLFDITIGAVTSLWDFVEGVVPAPEDIERAVAHVDYSKVVVDGDEVTLLDPEARIDLGGIAKGFIADELIALFRERGVESAFVNLGGNVMVMGGKPDGTPWAIGVQDPASETGEAIIAKVSASDGSVVTSGLYERCFERDGKTYWHILDPRTGYPVETDVVGATVFSERSIDGDGLTKPLFMLGHDEALSFLEDHPGVQGLLVMRDGTTLMTPDSDFELV